MAKIQTVKYTPRGRAYITHYDRRIYLDEVMRLNTPEIINGIKYQCVQGICNTAAFLVSLSSDGETARVIIK